jgi:hypothetical protein
MVLHGNGAISDPGLVSAVRSHKSCKFLQLSQVSATHGLSSMCVSFEVFPVREVPMTCSHRAGFWAMMGES